jgi:hypothetical protein
MAERTDPHAGESIEAPHVVVDDHASDDGHEDHAHAEVALGPIDTVSWGAAALGVILGLVVVLALVQAQG